MRAFGAWVGAELPTEAQWEFAARSRGQDITYPWGDQAPDCMFADWDDTNDNTGCNGAGTSPVCSFPNGDSAQGLCDLAGNLWNWVLDEYASDYNGAPVDGSPRCGLEDCFGGANRVFRGGAWVHSADYLRAANRAHLSPSEQNAYIGARLAR